MACMRLLFMILAIVGSFRRTNSIAFQLHAKRSLKMSATPIKITTYNVLSSHLAAPDYFTACTPGNLDPSVRLVRLKEKLDKEVAAGSIICLQEVSQLWAGQLHTYFSNRGYHFITGLYGNKFNGYMGVATAIPLKNYEILAVDISKVSDTKKTMRKPKFTMIQKLIHTVKETILQLISKIGLWKPAVDAWKESLRRNNEMIHVRLKSKNDINSRPFVVGTYHMPCAFYLPAVMMIHCALSVQLTQRLAKSFGSTNVPIRGGNNNNSPTEQKSDSDSTKEASISSGPDPYILVGDFNIKPGSNMYRMITEGKVEPNCPELPTIEAGDNWTPTVVPMSSAYAVAGGGKEPKFTNWSKVKEQEDFIDTLDYIFYSENDWSVQQVAELNTDTLKGPFPIATEPSDHLLLSAALVMKP